MTRHEATDEISSQADERAVRRLVDRTDDTLREELHELGDVGSDRATVPEKFQAIRDAAREPPQGTLTIVYETESAPDDSPAER